jgi:hypothetical protein
MVSTANRLPAVAPWVQTHPTADIDFSNIPKYARPRQPKRQRKKNSPPRTLELQHNFPVPPRPGCIGSTSSKSPRNFDDLDQIMLSKGLTQETLHGDFRESLNVCDPNIAGSEPPHSLLLPPSCLDLHCGFSLPV